MDVGELMCRHDRHLERQLSGARGGRIAAADRPPPAVSAKELDILRSLCLLRFACVERLSIHLDRYTRGIQRSLEMLRSKRLVGWFRWVDTANAVDGIDPLVTKPVYCLTTKGVERCMLDRVLDNDEYILTRSWRGRPVIHTLMPHQLGIVDIIIGLSIASRRSSTHEIVQMIPDFVNKEIEGKSRVATIELFQTDNEFRADLIAYARAKNSGEFFTLYIEFERRNKGHKEIIGKFDNYSALFTKKERRFNKGKPVLLYVVSDSVSPEKTEERIKLVTSWVQEKAVAPAFRIAPMSAVKERAFADIWKKADGTPWSVSK